MKRITALLLCVVLCVGMCNISAFAEEEIKIYVNGNIVEFDQLPVIENGRTLVPVRGVFEALGAEVSYDNGVVNGSKGSTKVVINVGSDKAYVDDEEKTLDVPAKIENGRTLVPLRFIGEAFGDDVHWEAKNKRIFVSSNNRAKKAPELEAIPKPETILSKLPEGEVIYTREDLMDEECFSFYNQRDPEDCTVKKVRVEGMPFSDAYQVDVTEEPDINYAYGFSAIGKADISQGDIVLVSITMRNINSAYDENNCSVELVYEQRESPWDKFLRATISAGQTWSTYYAYFTAKQDLKAKDMKMVIRLGGRPQLFEIGDFTMTNYKKSVTAEQMPAASYDKYEGIEPDAPWRKEADERIEKFRKGDMKVKVLDENGSPVSDAKVKINMTNHEFEFGSVLWTAPEFSNMKEYFEVLKDNFNTLVIGNELKWPHFETKTERSMAIAKWAIDNDFKLRGHTLVWDHTKHMPDDLRTLYQAGDFQAISDRFEKHIKEETTALKDYIYEWDVLNEPIMNKLCRSEYGDEFAAQWFKWAEESVPDTARILNDTGIVGFGTPKIQQLHDILDGLIKNGADIQGIGIQGHFGVCCRPEDFYKQLDELSKHYDLPIKVTEYSHNSDPIIQGYFTRDIMTEAFSLEKGNGFIMWGCDETTGGKSTPMYDKNWNLKPAGEQVRYLMFDKWWTDAVTVTDNDGEAGIRAFYGDYEITTEADGKKQVDIVRFLKDGKGEIVVRLGTPQSDPEAINREPKRSRGEIPDSAWESVKEITFTKDILSSLEKSGEAEISFDSESESVIIKTTDEGVRICVDGIFEGVDTSMHTPYKISVKAKNNNAENITFSAYPVISSKNNGEFKITSVNEEKGRRDVVLESGNEGVFTTAEDYFRAKKPNSICIEIKEKEAELSIESLTLYKLMQGYVPN